MADAVKEEMRAAFAQKIEQGKLGLEFTQLQSDESFAEIVSSLEGWDELTGAEKRERTVSLFGENNRSKGYKLAAKFRLLEVRGIVHVLTRCGRGGGFRLRLEEMMGKKLLTRVMPGGWCLRAPCLTFYGIPMWMPGATARTVRLMIA